MAYEFLKKLFGTPKDGEQPKTMTYAELEAAIDGAKDIQVVDLKAGGYVAKSKLDAKITELAGVQQQLTDLQTKYNKDTGDLRAQLADRDYTEAVGRAIAGKGLKFSSKSAERAFKAALKEQKLELKDGELTGLDDFIKAQREADPEAFAPDKAPPRFATGSGSGGGHGEPPEHIPANVAQAKEMGAARAANGKATSDVLSHYL